MEPSPGLEIGGTVKLVAKLGEGGMGSVWVAEHLALRTHVAVKFLVSHMARDPGAAERFRREATAAARIKSPHVVQIFDHGVSEAFGPYIVMELLEGETLSAFIERHGRLTPAVTASILNQLCKALGKAHQHGIVHRDIKPDNVFLIDSQREIFVKVLDFGIAKHAQEDISMTSTGAMMGTPHYMSPEQILSSKHVDLRSDLWAVGVVAYQCLTRALPFDGETFGSIAIAIAQGGFGAPSVTHGVGGPALDAWFTRALSRDVDGRFVSAAELAETFDAAVSGVAPWAKASLTSTHFGDKSVADFPVAPAATLPTFAGVAQTQSGKNGGGKRARLLIGGAISGVILLGAAAAIALASARQTTNEPLSVSASGVVSAVATAQPDKPARSSAPEAEPVRVTPTASSPTSEPAAAVAGVASAKASLRPVPVPARKGKPAAPATATESPLAPRQDRGF